MDVTLRKLADETLHESEERFKAIASNTPDHILMQDRELRYTFVVNPQLGLMEKDMIGKTDYDFLPKEEADRLTEAKTLVMKTGKALHFETSLSSQTGTLEFFEGTYVSRLDDKGQTKGLIGYFRNVTESKRAEEVLQRHAKRLRNLHKVDQAILLAIESPRSIAETALMHIRNLLSCQRAGVQLFDFEKNELKAFAIGVKAKAIMQIDTHPLEDFRGDLQILKQGMMDITEDLAGSSSPSAVTKSLLREGIHSYINVPLLSGTKLIGALNLAWNNPRTFSAEEKEIVSEVAGQIAIVFEQARLRSETEAHARDLEKRVQKRTIELEAANKELEAFSYSVSHDLRAPLRAVDGFSRILLEEHLSELSPEAQHYLDQVRANAVQMGQLIDDLLTFSRTSRQALTKRPVDVGEIVRQVLEELQGELKGRKANVIIGDLPQCRADPAMLKRVIFNLISNAVKFTRKKEVTEIEIGSINNDGKITYYVKDNGAGFDMNYASKLFGVFQRLHTGSEYEGTGVGLAIVQRIVHRHKGRVWAESEVDKGAKFYFTLEGDESH
jgi:PAS domain S-box-containing protein